MVEYLYKKILSSMVLKNWSRKGDVIKIRTLLEESIDKGDCVEYKVGWNTDVGYIVMGFKE